MAGRERTRLAVAVAVAAVAALATTTAALGSNGKRAGAGNETIKVHGGWTIEVRRPDGTLVSERRFENKLEPFMSGALGGVLAGQSVPGRLAVELGGENVGLKGPCKGEFFGSCYLFEKSDPGTPAVNGFKTLTVTSSAGALVLQGSAFAEKAGTIYYVQTWVHICPASYKPCVKLSIIGGNRVAGAAGGGIVDPFTYKGLGKGISVLKGQQILVKVAISFS